jgi:hypothetical protein
VIGEALDCQEKLVLLRFDAVIGGGRFAEVEKLADLAAELRQILILVGG